MPAQVQIRIRIGIKTMPIQMQILPQVLHMLEKREKNLNFIHSYTSLLRFLFLIKDKCVMIFNIWEIFTKKSINKCA